MLRIPHFLLLGLPLLAACAKGDNVPSYVEIPSVTLVASGPQGSATSRITDVWVSADEEFIGVWELPARVPVLKDGPTRITVTPGIKRNGMYDDRLRYPFYTAWDGTVDLVATETRTVQPTVGYISSTNFWIEAFEEAGNQFNVTESSDTTLMRFTPALHPDIVLNNTPCGGFVLDQAHPFIRIYTNENFQVNGGPVFLELDYRNDLLFTVGASFQQNGTPSLVPYVYVSETSTNDASMPWNRIYIDLSPLFNQGGITMRDIYIEASLPSGRTSGQVYLDNVKLVRTTP